MALTKIDDRGLKTPIDLLDGERIRLGNSQDLQLYHNGSNSFLQDQGTGNLYIDFGTSINLRKYVGGGAAMETVLKGTTDGAVELYFDNTVRFLTNSIGAQCQGDFLIPLDNEQLRIGAGSDLRAYHDGSNSFLTNATGALYIAGNDIRLTNAATNETYIKGTADGAVELYFDNSKKFDTNNLGVRTHGTHFLDGDVQFANNGFTDGILWDKSASTMRWKDNNKALFGDGSDLQIYHDGTYSRLVSSVNFFIQGDFISLLSANGVTTTFSSYSTGHITAGDSGTRTNFFGDSSTHKPHIQFSSANSNSKRGMSVLYGQAGTTGPYLVLGKHRSNSVNGTTACANGDELGLLSFQGSDGTNFKEGARIVAHANQTVSSGVIPGRLRFQVADASGNMQNRGGVHRDAGITGIEHHQFVFPIIGSTDQGSTISSPVERFNAPAFNMADTGDFASFAFSTHWRHRSYANVSIWFGESGNASGNTYDIAVQVRSASSGQGYTNTNHTFNIDVGTFSNGKMRNLDFSGSWPTHGAGRFVQGKMTFTKNISGTSLQYMGMRVVEYTDPA